MSCGVALRFEGPSFFIASTLRGNRGDLQIPVANGAYHSLSRNEILSCIRIRFLPGAQGPGFNLYLESSQIQLTSQVFPPSGGKSCSIRADWGETLSHI